MSKTDWAICLALYALIGTIGFFVLIPAQIRAAAYRTFRQRVLKQEETS